MRYLTKMEVVKREEWMLEENLEAMETSETLQEKWRNAP